NLQISRDHQGHVSTSSACKHVILIIFSSIIFQQLLINFNHLHTKFGGIFQPNFTSRGGQEKTLMFLHISPEVDAYGETMSTLKFAERVATGELGAATSNKESGEIRELKEQV
ncbi:hypothetical protein KI387_015648, partial [Taxus chinensis]